LGVCNFLEGVESPAAFLFFFTKWSLHCCRLTGSLFGIVLSDQGLGVRIALNCEDLRKNFICKPKRLWKMRERTFCTESDVLNLDLDLFLRPASVFSFPLLSFPLLYFLLVLFCLGFVICFCSVSCLVMVCVSVYFWFWVNFWFFLSEKKIETELWESENL